MIARGLGLAPVMADAGSLSPAIVLTFLAQDLVEIGSRQIEFPTQFGGAGAPILNGVVADTFGTTLAGGTAPPFIIHIDQNETRFWWQPLSSDFPNAPVTVLGLTLADDGSRTLLIMREPIPEPCDVENPSPQNLEASNELVLYRFQPAG